MKKNKATRVLAAAVVLAAAGSFDVRMCGCADFGCANWVNRFAHLKFAHLYIFSF